MKTIRTIVFLGILLCAGSFANAQTLIDTWTYEGGGLAPATYGQNLPSTLVPDAGSSGNATIALTGFTSGGLGSSSFGPYGGIYTFFSSGATFTLAVTNLLEGIDELTFTFLAGGGSPTLVSYLQSSIALNYNAENSAVTSSGFSTISGIIVDSPIGEQNLTSYTWTWSGLSTLGESTGFSFVWNTQGNAHVFLTDISVVQAVPEPSVIGLVGLAGVAFAWRCRRKNRQLGMPGKKL